MPMPIFFFLLRSPRQGVVRKPYTTSSRECGSTRIRPRSTIRRCVSVIFALEEYELAIAACKRGIEVTDLFIPNHYMLCLIYTLLGRDEETRVERKKLMELTGGPRRAGQFILPDEGIRLPIPRLARPSGVR